MSTDGPQHPIRRASNFTPMIARPTRQQQQQRRRGGRRLLPESSADHSCSGTGLGSGSAVFFSLAAVFFFLVAAQAHARSRKQDRGIHARRRGVFCLSLLLARGPCTYIHSSSSCSLLHFFFSIFSPWLGSNRHGTSWHLATNCNGQRVLFFLCSLAFPGFDFWGGGLLASLCVIEFWRSLFGGSVVGEYTVALHGKHGLWASCAKKKEKKNT